MSDYTQRRRAIPDPINIDWGSRDPSKPWVLHMVGLPSHIEIEIVDHVRHVLRQEGVEQLVHARLLDGKTMVGADAAIRRRYDLKRCDTLILERSQGNCRGLIAARHDMERFLLMVAALVKAANRRGH